MKETISDTSAGTTLNLTIEPASRSRLLKRAGWLALLLGLESAVYYFTHVPEPYRILLMRWGLLSVAFFSVLGYSKVRAWLGMLSREAVLPPVSHLFLCLHALTMGLFLFLSSTAMKGVLPAENPVLSSFLWLVTGLIGVAFAGLIFAPGRFWSLLIKSDGRLWICSTLAAGVAVSASRPLWDSFGIDLTFGLVKQILHPLLRGIYADPLSHVIGNEQFAVRVDSSCSGWEGLGLVAIFSLVVLWLGRNEYRFPQAFVLIPVSLALIFGLNSIRIASLVLIGAHGYPDVAIRGFHSQAGWIAFSLVAVTVSLLAPRIRWLRTDPVADGPPVTAYYPNPAIPFLLPFAVVLTAGMVSVAASAGFEWLYPIRLIAAATVLWLYRKQYGFLRWKPGWLPLLAGAIAFAVWVFLEPAQHSLGNLDQGLAKLSPLNKAAWLTLRTIAAVVTVPIAEELAFRGFLFRRMIAAEFECVEFTRFSYLAIIVSSVAFGLLHGQRWIAGTIAGALYACAMLRRGQLSDAVAAHATTNALLAGWVLIGGNWYFW
jgi:exosortase E/protease (VPEID-CTERM system)